MLIVGGGLAGLTAALDLADRGKEVLVIEKNRYPHHKVCGEYLSNEVRPYLAHLGVKLETLHLPEIDTLQISTQKGKLTEVRLPLGGVGVSRYTLDHQLYRLSKERGVRFLFETVSSILFLGNSFEVTLSSKQRLDCKVVLGAYGKRSTLDVQLKRDFIQRKSPWLGIKAHYENTELPSNVVGLHNFPGGYGGLSQIEDGGINFCYLVRYKDFKMAGDVKTFNADRVSQNPILKDFLSKAIPRFEKPLSIAQISFEQKDAVENHMLMCGDTAGLIHPLCGNGMAMAIHSAKLAVSEVVKYMEDPNFSRKEMENAYRALWTNSFKHRLWMGRRLQDLMLHTNWFNLSMQTLSRSKVMLRAIIKRTHGNPIMV